MKLGAIFLLAMSAGAYAELDLTPMASFYEVEGVRAANVEFRDGSNRVKYTPPAAWNLSGGGKRLTLTPPDAVQAGAMIVSEPVRQVQPAATAESAKAYGEIAKRLAPDGASKIEVVEATVSPLEISGKAMVDITLSYSFFGQMFRMNVLIMPREKEQLRFQISARAADYPALFKTFRSSLYSMQGL